VQNIIEKRNGGAVICQIRKTIKTIKIIIAIRIITKIKIIIKMKKIIIVNKYTHKMAAYKAAFFMFYYNFNYYFSS
jgi:hypothetical protein